MACDGCRTAGLDCDCGPGRCADCDERLFGPPEDTVLPTELTRCLTAEEKEEVAAINADIDAFLDANPGLEALLNLPGAYLASMEMQGVPGVLEVEKMHVTFESIGKASSSTPNVQNFPKPVEGNSTGAVLVVSDCYGTDVRQRQGWSKGYSQEVLAPGAPLTMAEQMLFAALFAARMGVDELKASIEKVAGPCEVEVYGSSVIVRRVQPEEDGNQLEFCIDY